MKKLITELENKSLSELQAYAYKLREELTRARIDAVANVSKDTNLMTKRKKQLAQITTTISHKEESI